jgi:hypothetical protein
MHQVTMNRMPHLCSVLCGKGGAFKLGRANLSGRKLRLERRHRLIVSPSTSALTCEFSSFPLPQKLTAAFRAGTREEQSLQSRTLEF